MPFDAIKPVSRGGERRIAVIGSGISGLSAAWLLSKAHEVVIYEKESRLGGHSNTVDIELESGVTPVDTGFIVFNEPGYPNFTALLAHLGVATEESCMSFGVSLEGGRVEYSGQTFSSVFAKRSNAVSPSFWKMLADIPRFHRDAKAVLQSGFCAQASLGEFVKARRYGDGFCNYFLKPMASAIWSTPQMRVFDYPALSFLQFFENHGLLRVLNLPVWHTVSGGSRTYVDALAKSFGANVRLGTGVASVERCPEGVGVVDLNGQLDVFDEVVIASHADAASRMVKDKTADEHAVLSAFSYQPNRAVLHTDASYMPHRRRAWSSWNYVGGGENGSVSYWMNRLQNLDCKEDIFVTLNPAAPIREDAVVAAFDYDHPMFNGATEKAQQDIWRLQGRGGVWYAGAHLGHGFHEDGLQSGLAVAEAIGGVRRPWSVDNESGRLHAAAPLEAAA